jgi:replication-associated recombination protein RarA
MQLVEKYRPKRLGQVVGQDNAVKKIRALTRRDGFDRGAFYLEGPTGTGKTSIAQALAWELGGRRDDRGRVVKPCPSWAYDELDGDKCTVDSVRQLDEKSRLTQLEPDQWRVFVINECHAMTSKAVQAWLTLLERLPRRWLVVFTTTEDSGDLFGGFSRPFRDRCIYLKLTNQGLAPRFARLVQGIATREGLNGRPLADYLRLAKTCNNSARAMLHRVESGDMLPD